MSQAASIQVQKFSYGDGDSDLLLQAAPANPGLSLALLAELDRAPRPNWPDSRIVEALKELDPWGCANEFGTDLDSIDLALDTEIFYFEDQAGNLVVVDTMAEWLIVRPVEQ